MTAPTAVPTTDASTRTKALVVIAVVTTLATLYAAHWFFVPLALGVTLAAVLYPLVEILRRAKMPAAPAATIAVITAAAIIIAVGAVLEPPMRDLALQVPRSIIAARAKLTEMGGPFARIATFGLTPSTPAPALTTRSGRRTTSTSKPATPPAPVPTVLDSALNATVPVSTSAAGGQSNQSSAPAPGGAQSLSIVQRVFGSASSLLGELVEIVLLALFLLAAGGAWKNKLAVAVRDPARRKNIEDGLAEMRGVVTRYFVVTLLINTGQAIVIALGLMFLGYPSVLLWGALTFVLEFIPYLGGLLMVALLLVVGLANGGSLLDAFAGPALYLTVTTLQNNLVSPIAYGRGLRLNPTAILGGLMLFWGLWGVAGAFLAVPILAAFQVVAHRVDSLNGVAAFLSD